MRNQSGYYSWSGMNQWGKTQPENKHRLFGNGDEGINHLSSECSSLTQKCMCRYGWVVKRMHWDVSQVHEFKVTEKWYEDKPKIVRGNMN